MRHAFIVTYDVCDPKRLRKVFKIMCGHGDHLQLSVFRCELDPTELVSLRAELSQVIHHKEDQVLFINFGLVTGRARESIQALGLPYERPERTGVVV